MDARALVKQWDITRDPIDHWRRRQRAEQFIRPKVKDTRRANTHQVAEAAQAPVVTTLEQLGYTVALTAHKAPFDLLVNQALKIEVKGAKWHQTGGRGRYQASIRQHQRKADLLVFGCFNKTWRYFIIPTALITTRSLTIRCVAVASYTGKWAAYLDRWDLVAETLVVARTRPHQLTLEDNDA